jgi:hypothetical protein
MEVTIIPAVIIPIIIGVIAFFGGIPNNQAAMDPVQAPVIGKGIATNRNRAKFPYFLIFFEVFRLVLSKTQLRNLSNGGKYFFARLLIFFNPKIKKNTGIILPIIAKNKTYIGFSPQEIARGIDALNSVIGKAEYKIVNNSDILFPGIIIKSPSSYGF